MSIKQVTHSVWYNPGNRGQRVRKSWAAVRWQARKRVVGTRTAIRLANGTRFWAYPDCVVSSALIYADWPEYNELQFIRRRLRPGELVFDIGANVGHFSLLLSDRVGPENVSAFEPTPVTFARLVENWQLNGWPVDHLYPVAVGAEEGSARLPNVTRPLTTNSLLPPDVSGGLEVPLVSLDSLHGHWQDRAIGLIKIDVEGYEREVLRGCRRLLADDRPRLLMFESLEGHVESEIAALLDAVGYARFELNAEGRPDFVSSAAQNQFAVPHETLADIDP
jgi:FkbM family methyltransferase